MKSFNKLVKTIAVSTLGLGIATGSISEAQATSLVPTQEGEIKTTNLGCLDAGTINCIDTTDGSQVPFTYAVTSLDFDGDGGFDESRLFADDRNTANPELVPFGITFLGEDEGTNPEMEQMWFRPVAFKDGEAFEDGRLEVGLFEFDFLGKTASQVKLDFFDVEDDNFTGIIKVNGVQLEGEALQELLLPGGENGNVQSLVLNDVQNFTVQLCIVEKSQFPSVYGVALAVSVPESENVIGLSGLAVAGVLTLKRRKKASQKA